MQWLLCNSANGEQQQSIACSGGNGQRESIELKLKKCIQLVAYEKCVRQLCKT